MQSAALNEQNRAEFKQRLRDYRVTAEPRPIIALLRQFKLAGHVELVNAILQMLRSEHRRLIDE